MKDLHQSSWQMKTLPAHKLFRPPQRNRSEINMAQKSPEMIHGVSKSTRAIVSVSSSRKAMFLFNLFCCFWTTKKKLVLGYESFLGVGSTLVPYPQKESFSAFAVLLLFLECYYELQQLVFPVEQISNSAQLLCALDDSGLFCTRKNRKSVIYHSVSCFLFTWIDLENLLKQIINLFYLSSPFVIVETLHVTGFHQCVPGKIGWTHKR